jgi:DNA-binding transcriptional ArsR family regulator
VRPRYVIRGGRAGYDRLKVFAARAPRRHARVPRTCGRPVGRTLCRPRLRLELAATDASTVVEASRVYDRPVQGEADISAVGALLAEPARAQILLALGDGRSLAASVLAVEAGVSASTASHHLARLVDAGLVAVEPRGRHRYFALAGPDVGALIEAVARVAPTRPVTSLRQGTRAHSVRYARSCYDHLAGRVGVALADGLCERGVLERTADAEGFAVTVAGATVLGDLDVRVRSGDIARACLDWTEQRAHVAGPLGRELLARLLDLGWLAREQRTRAIRVTDTGRVALPDRLGIELPPT